MDNNNLDVTHIERVRLSLERNKLEGELHDDGRFVHVQLDSGRTFQVSHLYLRMANTRTLDKRVKEGAGLKVSF